MLRATHNCVVNELIQYRYHYVCSDEETNISSTRFLCNSETKKWFRFTDIGQRFMIKQITIKCKLGKKEIKSQRWNTSFIYLKS